MITIFGIRKTPVFGRTAKEDKDNEDFRFFQAMVEGESDENDFPDISSEYEDFDANQEDVSFSRSFGTSGGNPSFDRGEIKQSLTKKSFQDSTISVSDSDPLASFRAQASKNNLSGTTLAKKKPVEVDKNTMSKIESNLRASKRGTIDETNCITADILMSAPRDFFDKYETPTKLVVEKIQDNISNSNKSQIISQLKANPTDITLRESAFSTIYNEFMAYDSKAQDSEYKSLNQTEKSIVLTLATNEICGLGPLEPLYKDHKVREIICNGPRDVQVEIAGKIEVVPSCKFRDTAHLQSLISRLYNSVNKEVTRTNPYERARLHDNSRVFAVDTAIAPDGPNLNIRRHTDDWTDPQRLIDWKTISPEMMEWLGAHINAGLSFLINGGTATGKTTTLASLSGFLPNTKRVVTIEKNIELKLPKTKLVAAAMECIPRKNNNASFEITMRDLVECTTQMRPDIIICGEIVSDEAYDFVQAGNTGHQLGGTVHSNTSEACMSRMASLISQAGLMTGKDTFELITNSLDLIVTLKRFPQDGSRKIVEIAEVGTNVELGDNGVQFIPVRPIWQFIPDEFENVPGAKVTGRWEKVGEISQERAEKHNLPMIKLKNLDELRELYIEEVK